MTRPDARTLALAAAFLLAIAAAFGPTTRAERPVYDLVAIVDITMSMNARDYVRDGRPQSRLDAVKERLVAAAARLPCGTRMGLGVFTERRSFMLLAPLDVCANFTAFTGAVSSITWRMAWEGDSRVSSGLFEAVQLARESHADLVFLTDGQEAPPLRADQPLTYDGKRGDVRGLLVGVGGDQLTPIPKYDDFGRETGFLSMTDVPQESRLGPPPADAESRPGYNPRNAPFGEMPGGEEHLTSVREPHLRELGGMTGLGYTRLGAPEALAEAIEANAVARRVPVRIDLSPIPAAAALLALSLVYGAPFAAGIRRRMRPHAT
ncbi:vWA domain-containing protein [Hansschlegelia plantiphila]|uniref:VWFA domain-containing protein n=1 Tax=Hansschlegelia plantiphila TaxID=374655 RepID=A0A9W6IZN7_9HYPH|nr:vWA domain-containing protein [Hansschlegelia plantiphila]GLK67997.1 hypothetical protein GCM10008179_16350 [Hansschlegelia plantiphila]